VLDSKSEDKNSEPKEISIPPVKYAFDVVLHVILVCLQTWRKQFWLRKFKRGRILGSECFSSRLILNEP
jgi:hypothetical protein